MVTLLINHSEFTADGKTVRYDLQTPRSGVFWLAGVDLDAGQRAQYLHKRDK
jgi:oligogalacturonide lyase